MTLRATIEAIFEPRVRGASQARKDGDEPSNLMWRTLYDLRAEVLAAIEEHEKEVICREYRVEMPRLADQISEKEEPKSDWPTCSYPGCTDPAGSKVAGKWYCGPHSFMVANGETEGSKMAREIRSTCNNLSEAERDAHAATAMEIIERRRPPDEPIKWITGQPSRNTEP